MYPTNDRQYEEATIKEVQKEKSGWSITRSDAWSFSVPEDSHVVPAVGMTARFYGGGIGSTVRGLYLNGEKVYYRTEDEDKEYNEIELYGKDAADWLKRWDEGRSVWSIEMGGLGPGYEQCIQITAAEILRHMLAKAYVPELWDDGEMFARVRDEIETMCLENTTIKALGLSGAQWGAALNLAAMFFRKGPRLVMMDERVKDRQIQVERTFPRAVAA